MMFDFSGGKKVLVISKYSSLELFKMDTPKSLSFFCKPQLFNSLKINFFTLYIVFQKGCAFLRSLGIQSALEFHRVQVNAFSSRCATVCWSLTFSNLIFYLPCKPIYPALELPSLVFLSYNFLYFIEKLLSFSDEIGIEWNL